MQNPKSQEPRPKQKRGRKRRILREEDDADDYNNVLSENDGDTSACNAVNVNISVNVIKHEQDLKKKQVDAFNWRRTKTYSDPVECRIIVSLRPLSCRGQYSFRAPVFNNARMQRRTSFSSAPNQKPKPEVQHVLNEVIRRIDRKLLRTLVPVSTKEKTFDREQLTSQNAALQVAVMSEVEENTILQQQIEEELRELENEENELRLLKERNQAARRQSDRQLHKSTQNTSVDRIQDYAQALIKINQLSKPNFQFATESDDEYLSEEDGPLQRIKMSIGGKLQQVDEQTAYMDSAAADIMETSHAVQSVMTSRARMTNRSVDRFSDDDDFM
ncbi:unnamed protein product [Umbelopsis vinacea]